jgi:hypothetical protein
VTLASKIFMCLNMWLPPEGMHVASGELLSYMYNQEIAVEQFKRGKAEKAAMWLRAHPYHLSLPEFKQLFSLPNSDYRFIPDCINAETSEML